MGNLLSEILNQQTLSIKVFLSSPNCYNREGNGKAPNKVPSTCSQLALFFLTELHEAEISFNCLENCLPGAL